MSIRKLAPLLALLVQPRPVSAQEPNPFLPPLAKVHYAPSRQYDLQHVKVELKLDWPKRRFTGRVTHQLEILRSSEDVQFDAGPDIKVKSITVNGAAARSEHKNDKLKVYPAQKLARGATVTVQIDYEFVPPAKGRPALNGGYGFHWVEPDRFDPARKPAFWTQGETVGNREWVPIYDYPNDMTTTETIVEAPEGWFVIGNGNLVSDRVDSATRTRTFHWSMRKPHVTYLLSLAGGEMDVVKSEWKGIDLYYCVPRGEKHLIPPSFGDTPDMMEFFTRTTGVDYPWPKYAQSALFDFHGGMENVSATTLGEEALADSRGGIRPMASLNAHELAHQWFGDIVTCRDWSHIWLNESFATFFQALYFEHARGKDAYDQEREGQLRAYLDESKRYKRAIVTRLYPHPDQMFDSHTYPKGALVLHMLRREMGDEDFFKGVRHYLAKHTHRPVDTYDLIRALEESTGRSLEAFFDQWVFKPGHPVIDYSWRYDESAREVVVDVRQVQDTKDGTPVYHLRMSYHVISGSTSGGGFAIIEKTSDQIRIPAQTRPEAVLLDAGHDILMERKVKVWQPGEREAVLRSAPSWIDRRDAALAILANDPTDTAVESVTSHLSADGSPLLKRAILDRLGQLKRIGLKREFMLQAMPSKLRAENEPHAPRDPEVIAAAIRALGQLPHDPALAEIGIVMLKANEDQYPVLVAVMDALSNWDADRYLHALALAATYPSRHEVLRIGALNAIAKSNNSEALSLLVRYAQGGNSRPVRKSAVSLLERRTKDRMKAAQTFLALLRDEDPQVVREVLTALGRIGAKSALPTIRALEKSTRDEAIKSAARAAAETIEKS